MIIKHLGLCDYQETWQQMSAFTDDRTPDTEDEIWLLQHPAVFTLGKNGKREHLLGTGDIPVVDSDRGGQVTYHGPGQLVAYVMIDIQRQKTGVRQLVTRLEEAVIAMLQTYGIASRARDDAPGVYVGDAKIAALGLRVRRGKSFHGLSLNVDMDMEPFTRINPCGYAGMEVTQMKDLLPAVGMDGVTERLLVQLQNRLE